MTKRVDPLVEFREALKLAVRNSPTGRATGKFRLNRQGGCGFRVLAKGKPNWQIKRSFEPKEEE